MIWWSPYDGCCTLESWHSTFVLFCSARNLRITCAIANQMHKFATVRWPCVVESEWQQTSISTVPHFPDITWHNPCNTRLAQRDTRWMRCRGLPGLWNEAPEWDEPSWNQQAAARENPVYTARSVRLAVDAQGRGTAGHWGHWVVSWWISNTSWLKDVEGLHLKDLESRWKHCSFATHHSPSLSSFMWVLLIWCLHKLTCIVSALHILMQYFYFSCWRVIQSTLAARQYGLRAFDAVNVYI